MKVPWYYPVLQGCQYNIFFQSDCLSVLSYMYHIINTQSWFTCSFHMYRCMNNREYRREEAPVSKWKDKIWSEGSIIQIT